MKKNKFKQNIKLFNITKLRFAIEIECEFPNSKDSQKLIDRHSVIKGWTMDFDGSLENGAEYRPKNKHKLYWNEETLTQIKEILALIRVHRGRISPRCGLHIHCDCSKLTDKQILTIIKEWIHKQRFIIKKFNIDQKRLDNYAKLLPRQNLQLLTEKQIHEFRQKQSFEWTGRGYSYFDEKYYSLNISHLSQGDYGTIEFRLWDATLNYRKLIERIKFTLEFIRDCIERE